METGDTLTFILAAALCFGVAKLLAAAVCRGPWSRKGGAR